MEKFYKIKKDSELWKRYFDWEKNFKENNEFVKRFCEEHNIESNHYYCDKESFYIVPTKNDKENFKNQFTKKELNDGLRQFRRNSVIGKSWTKETVGRAFLHKPYPGWLNIYMGRSSTRLFSYQGELYCSIEADRIGVPENTFTEIKGSDFFKIIEELEEKQNGQDGQR